MTLYGFFFCSCIYESGFSLVSLHRTKKGAYQAMRSFLVGRHEKWRDDVLELGHMGYRGHKARFAEDHKIEMVIVEE